MSSRDLFWFLAGVLVTVAIGLTMRAWVRGRPALSEGPPVPAFAVPIAAALALLGVALGIYFLLGTPMTRALAHAAGAPGSAVNALETAGLPPPATQPTTNAGSLDEVTQRLATRLATKGGSDSEWKLLAESYDYMGRTEEAKAARAHTASLATRNAAQTQAVTAVTAGEIAAVSAELDGANAAAGLRSTAPTSGAAR